MAIVVPLAVSLTCHDSGSGKGSGSVRGSGSGNGSCNASVKGSDKGSSKESGSGKDKDDESCSDGLMVAVQWQW